jgi:acylphosphatase
MPCAKFVVSGRVQGVFFRASTRTEALRLGLNGYAKNLANGDVEVVACGDSAALAALGRWLLIGPPSARVQGVVHSDVEPAAFVGFATH